jgi:hypothetical protein
MSNTIKDIIDYADDDDDDDDDIVPDQLNQTVSPKHVILLDINGKSTCFDADPDDGFEILDGSDPENNDYCFIAQNIPKLYRVLFDSIKDQLKSHYVYKIDSELFDELLEDMVITVSVSFVNEYFLFFVKSIFL